MADYAYERLTAQDRSFLVFEGSNTHMHVGGVTIFERAPLATPDGGVDIERIRSYIGSRLHWIPRYRQRLATIPIEDYPVWVDDEQLNLQYHVRHTSLPRPGDDRQLKRLTARIMSQQLDRRRPLWEVWLVEGLQDDRFAMILKTHHCVVDGISGVDLMSVLLRPTPETTFEEPPRWTPRPAPTAAKLLRDELLRRVATPMDVVRWARGVLRDPQRTGTELLESSWAALDMIGIGLRRPADTPVNQPIGPYRRFDWHRLDLADVKAVKNHLGGTVNDVILATVTGALRRFLIRRRSDPSTLEYKAVVPVSVRSPAEFGTSGNHVSGWMLTLPIHEPDPVKRLVELSQTTDRLKHLKQGRGIEIFTQVAELANPILTLGVRLAARMHPYNLIITNIPGPQAPFYMLGAPMLGGYPTVPLFEYQGLGVATFSYDGNLFWGINADWDLVHDLHEFVADIAASFKELHTAAMRAGKPAKAVRPEPPKGATKSGVRTASRRFADQHGMVS
jgi:WS/DGAT/MGAT family acyltransferase